MSIAATNATRHKGRVVRFGSSLVGVGLLCQACLADYECGYAGRNVLDTLDVLLPLFQTYDMLEEGGPLLPLLQGVQHDKALGCEPATPKQLVEWAHAGKIAAVGRIDGSRRAWSGFPISESLLSDPAVRDGARWARIRWYVDSPPGICRTYEFSGRIYLPGDSASITGHDCPNDPYLLNPTFRTIGTTCEALP
ncbi:MAG: hypothetical protein H6747_12465 [Deltaproteobacteria bacterium]|nr:hypothetical protein [Deltaproteobacteria bacterium]